MSQQKGKKIKKEELRKSIHVVLIKNRVNKFNILKKKFEQNSDVDVVRLCIDKTYDSLDKKDVILKDIISEQTSFILSNDYFRNKYLFESENDIINDAVNKWLQTIKQEFNLHHIPFRNQLSEHEKQIALVFIEYQLKFEKGMTFDNIYQHSKNLDEMHVRQILSRFLKNNLIIKDTIDGIDYYYAPIP